MAEKRKYSSPFLRYDGPVLLPPIRLQRAPPPSRTLPLYRPGGPPLSLEEKLGAQETLEQLEELWAGACDLPKYGLPAPTPEQTQAYLEAKRRLAPRKKVR